MNESSIAGDYAPNFMVNSAMAIGLTYFSVSSLVLRALVLSQISQQSCLVKQSMGCLQFEKGKQFGWVYNDDDTNNSNAVEYKNDMNDDQKLRAAKS